VDLPPLNSGPSTSVGGWSAGPREPPTLSEKPNSLKRTLVNSQIQLGLWCSLGSALCTELVAGSGADWLLIDCEHAPNDLRSVVGQLQAVGRYSVEPMVRLPSDERTLIKQFLDVGARSLMIPNVDSAEQAKAIVAGTRYPPEGVRGFSSRHRANEFGRAAHYRRTATERQLLAVQIETPEAVKNAAAIARVEGVDVLFVGPGDLAMHTGGSGDPDSGELQAAFGQVLAAAAESRKAAGIWAPDPAFARRCIARGFRMVAIGSDAGVFVNGLDALVAGLRTAP
jgi:2-dehydro-3-deoxyglucarate aldolase